MDTASIIAAIDEEIARLEKVKSLLSDGRPIGSATSFAFGANHPRRKRVLSKEARAKIAAAQKKRWAKQRAAQKAGGKKS